MCCGGRLKEPMPRIKNVLNNPAADSLFVNASSIRPLTNTHCLKRYCLNIFMVLVLQMADTRK
jgi:hypothetical protein